MAFDFLVAFGELNKLLTQQDNYTTNETLFRTLDPPCTPAIDHQRFYLWLLLPGITLSVLLALTQTRKKVLQNCLYGRPGLLIPHNTLSRSNRFSYAAAYGAIAFLCASVILESKYAINYQGPTYLKVFVALVSMFIYGVGYFPLFASLAVDSVVGYGIGSLYAWLLSTVTYYNTFYCPGLSAIEYFMLVVRGFPELLCLLYLCFSLPVRFLRALRRRHFFGFVEDHWKTSDFYEAIGKSYNGLHVRALLIQRPPPPKEPDSTKEKLISLIKSLPGKIIYKRVPGFRYSSRVLSVMTVGLILLYRLTVESLMFLIPGFQYLEIILNGAYEEVDKLRVSKIVSDIWIYDGTIKTIGVLSYILNASRACILTALCLAFVLGVVMILHSLASYRTNLLQLYKGNQLHLTPKEEKSSESLLVGSMRFAGYQVAYITWGFVVQFLLLWLIFLLVTTVVTLIKWNLGGWLIYAIHQVWPVLLTSLVVNLIQLVFAKFMFLQENDHGNVLAIDNRRSFFILVYFTFFYNIFTGWISCLFRIGKAILLGALILPRLDVSTLPRRFQWLDPGFDAYCGFMHIESAHTNPVAMVFIRILQAAIFHKRRKTIKLEISLDPTEKGEVDNIPLKEKKSNYRAQFRWHLVFTLLNNPNLLLQRKNNLLLTRKADFFREEQTTKTLTVNEADLNTHL